MKKIPLTRGKVALVSDEDYERVAEKKWTAARNKYTWYAMHYYRDHGGKVRAIYMHRFILNAPPTIRVDHRNRNGLDNRRCNIRLATAIQNGHNRRKDSSSKQQFKGVIERGGRHYVRLKVGERVQSFGGYPDAEAAARVYDAIATRLRGEFALTNFPDIDPTADDLAAELINKEKDAMSRFSRTARRRNVSARPEIFRAADELAKDAGHGSFSRVVQDLVVNAAVQQYGPNWRLRFEADDPADEDERPAA